MKSTAIVISLLGHLTVFSLFSFSFGGKIPNVNFTQVSFWGMILDKADLADNNRPFNNQDMPKLLLKKSGILTLSRQRAEIPIDHSIISSALRPHTGLVFQSNKVISMPEVISNSSMPVKKEPVIMFYPQLPYHFTLYFKDRQAVHIELMFNIISKGKEDAIALKRKISSGNLEADLLCMRYISRYLFIQRMGFPLNSWQTVKIDLTAPK